MLKTILFLIYILLILTVIFVERKCPTEALLWVLILVCLPYLGAVLYLVFGGTMAIKITAFVRKQRLKNHYPNGVPKHTQPEKLQISETDSQVMHFNAVYNDSQVVSYKEAQLYISGESFYRQLFADIQKAKECIYIEFYTIHHDQMGEALASALTKKAREGVKVLVLCDFVANLSTPSKMYRELVRAGGKVIRMKPYFTHYRSHRKIVAIDHTVSYIGGMNIGKQYANLAKVKNPWRDTQVRMEGSCTHVLDEYFLTDWLCSVRRRDWKETVDYIDTMEQQVRSGSAVVTPLETGKLPAAVPSNDNLCQFVVGGVDTSREGVKMCYLSMIRSAKKRIRIQSPYFIPDASVLDALKTAAAAGVEIELMIPGIKASFFLDPVTTYYSGQLMEYGAKVYKYKGYIHAKTMVIDEELCCIGSVNMDMRSLMVDDEICGVFYDNELVNRYSQIYTSDIQDCVPYTWEDFTSRSKKDRALESFFLMFAPLM